MPAYVIANIDVHDADGYRAYVEGAPATVAEHGGRYIARGGESEVLEGEWQPKRLVILEFPSMEQARAWHRSAPYRALREIRVATTSSDLVLTEGL